MTYFYLDSKKFSEENLNSIPFFYDGVATQMNVEWTKNSSSKFQSLPLKGEYEEHFKPFKALLKKADFSQITSEKNDNWTNFIANYFLSRNIEFKITLKANTTIFETLLPHHYIWIRIESSRIFKAEFGRYLPLEKETDIRKPTSFAKGVFINSSEIIEFIQPSWDGESGEIYQAEFSADNMQLFSDYLDIPCQIGWKEKNFQIGNSGFYKASISVNQEKSKSFEYRILNVGEQDMPLPWDKLEQRIDTFWRDSFFNNWRRNDEEVDVKPIIEGSLDLK